MKKKLTTVLSLPPREIVLLAAAWSWLLVADLALRLLPLAKAHRYLTPEATKGLGPLPADRVAFLVATAARHHLYEMTCLRRAFVLERLLRRCGYTAVLQIGVCRQGGELRAHSWVEHEGQPVGDRPDIATVFPPLLSSSALLG